jgi:nitrite reductase (NADH) small subunit
MRSDWVEIGGLDDVPARGARTVRCAGGPSVAVFRTADDEIYALIDRCPHRGGPLSEGIVSGRSVACPLHNWVIELDSGQAKAPDVGCVLTVPARLAAGRIFLQLGAHREPLTLGEARWEAA